jgi:hypothetical protein
VYQGVADGSMPPMEMLVSPFLHPSRLLHELDKKYFTYNREKLMNSWLSQSKSLLLARLQDGAYSGYGLYLPAMNGFKISPLLAEEYETAEQILKALVGHLEQGTKYCIDVPEDNVNAVRLAEKMNMKKIAAYKRMYTQSDSNVSRNNIYSFTHYELG